MISDRTKGVQHSVLVCQCILVTAAFWGWLFLCHRLPIDRNVVLRYLTYNEFILLGMLVLSWRSRLHLGLRSLGFEETSRRSFRQLGGTLFYLLLYLVAAHDAGISRLFLFSFIPVLFLMLFATNRYLPSLIGPLTFRHGFEEQVILVGPRRKAEQVQCWLNKEHYLGLRVAGLLTDDEEGSDCEPKRENHAQPCTPEAPAHAQARTTNGSTQSKARTTTATHRIAILDQPHATPRIALALDGPRFPAPNPQLQSLPVLGHPEDLEGILKHSRISKVIMVEFPRGNGSMADYTRLCEKRGIRLLVVADIDKIFEHSVTVFEDEGMFFLGLREEPLEDPVNRLIKRCLDIVVAGCVVVFILPIVSAIVWLLQRFQSTGPLLYRQVRPGFHNRPFDIYKFRTLHVDNPDVNRLPSDSDPRVYPAGRWLRKLSIDELPQFWNVLRGEMSVVGPRPHLMVDNDRFPRLYNKAYVRTLVKPGITGLAQARGFRGIAADREDVMSRMESDIEYLENWSFWLDCWLILRTALQMIVPPKTAV